MSEFRVWGFSLGSTVHGLGCRVRVSFVALSLKSITSCTALCPAQMGLFYIYETLSNERTDLKTGFWQACASPPLPAAAPCNDHEQVFSFFQGNPLSEESLGKKKSTRAAAFEQ